MNLNYTLENHPKSYQLSYSEMLSLLAISPYAQRHYELYQKLTGPLRWGHRKIAYFEFIPVIGGVGSLVERLIVKINQTFLNRFQNNYQELAQRPHSPDTNPENSIHPASLPSIKKMLKNFYKTVKEQRPFEKEYIPNESQLKINWQPKEKPLIFYCSAAEGRGRRDFMEDAHFLWQNEDCFLGGVFDGHGSCNAGIGKYAAQHFPAYFFQALKQFPYDIKKAFETVIDQIHEELLEKEGSSGSTAVICYIDKKTHLIYTATLGDSEAKIYRKIGEKTYNIPISCVRDWSSPKDAARAALVLDDPTIAERWPKESYSKDLRCPWPGPNVSRALCDEPYITVNGHPCMSHKPKVTVQQVQPGDILIIACDGLWDFVSHSMLIDSILEPNWDYKKATLTQKVKTYALNYWHSNNPDWSRPDQTQLAQLIVNYGLRHSNDNVSAVVLRVV